MLFRSDHVRVSAEFGTATLWLDFPGEPVNALDLARLRELDAALAAVEANPSVNILVVRSAKPAGCCAGIHPEALASLTTAADRAAFAWVGQQVFTRLATLSAVTVAFLDGPCLGAGLELALACDHRLVLCRPTTHLGFPAAPHGIPPCFGGTVRLRKQLGRRAADQLLASGRTLSGREARALGLVDHAFCERRGKIELRTFLDALERRGPRPKPGLELVGFADERRALARALDAAAVARQLEALRPLRVFPEPANPVPPFPAVVGLLGEDDDASRLAAEAALRGSEVVASGSAAGVLAGIAVALARGFVTPLEAEQTRGRVTVSQSLAGFDRAGLVLAAEGERLDELAEVVRPRCVVAVRGASPPVGFPHPRRVIGLNLDVGAVLLRGPGTDSDTVAAVAVWLTPFGFTPRVENATARPVRVAA
jgi:enoyl-CoA hydratase/carnithine racemase